MSTCLTDSGTTALLYAEEELADSENSKADWDKSTDDEEGNVMVSDWDDDSNSNGASDSTDT
jgi:hypothetical protein